MSTNNNNWICFECRKVKRQPKRVQILPVCASCHDPLFCLGYKVEVPAYGKIKAWKKLRDECRARVIASADNDRKARVRQIHATEREIARLTALGPNKDRQKQIEALKEWLAGHREFRR